jgi:hypothetical protein
VVEQPGKTAGKLNATTQLYATLTKTRKSNNQ